MAETIEVHVPTDGVQGTTEITLAAWLKQPGDAVEKDEVIAETLTDKANTEILAPIGGTVEALLAEEGDVVSPGQAIARISAS